MIRLRAAAVAAALLLGLVVISDTGASTPTGKPAHVVVLVMENKSYSQIIGYPGAPYINDLAKTYALAKNYVANFHPSEPNYIALLFGSNMGVTDDGENYKISGTQLADQVKSAGKTWNGWMENMPPDSSAPCLFPSAYPYRKKHNPMASSVNIQNVSANCARVRPYSSGLGTSALPSYSLVVPNMCHDMHDCSITTGDNWLKTEVPKILAKMSGHDVLILTWDEGSSSQTVVTIAAGPGARRGYSNAIRYSHYSTVRTIEWAFGLTCLRNACGATALTDLLN